MASVSGAILFSPPEREKNPYTIYLCSYWTISPCHMRVLECLITFIKYARSITQTFSLWMIHKLQGMCCKIEWRWMAQIGTEQRVIILNLVSSIPGNVSLRNNWQCNAELWLLRSQCLQGIQSYWSSVAPSLLGGSLSVFPFTRSHKCTHIHKQTNKNKHRRVHTFIHTINFHITVCNWKSPQCYITFCVSALLQWHLYLPALHHSTSICLAHLGPVWQLISVRLAWPGPLWCGTTQPSRIGMSVILNCYISVF